MIYYEDFAQDVNLIKWPAFMVRGKPVTLDQAAEIIIRCDDNNWGHCNNHDFGEEVRKAFGYPKGYRVGEKYDFDAFSKRRKELRMVELNYLASDAICSSWIGGPFDGWINWNGVIENPKGKNIGKWPHVDEVAEDWLSIAQAWPFLDLWCQLWNCEAWSPESCDNDPKPVVEYEVKAGNVLVRVPKKARAWPADCDLSFCLGRQPNCTIDNVKHGISLVESAG